MFRKDDQRQFANSVVIEVHVISQIVLRSFEVFALDEMILIFMIHGSGFSLFCFC